MLTNLAVALAVGDTGGVAVLLSDVDGGGAVADQLMSRYGSESSTPLTNARLTYTVGEPDVAISMSTADGGGPSGRFGCETGTIITLDA